MMPLDLAHVEVAAESKEHKQQQDHREPDQGGAADRESGAEPKAWLPRAVTPCGDRRHRRKEHFEATLDRSSP